MAGARMPGAQNTPGSRHNGGQYIIHSAGELSTVYIFGFYKGFYKRAENLIVRVS
jgi:hypothetical protein